MKDVMWGITLGLLVVGPVGLGLFAFVLAQWKIFFTAPKEAKPEFIMEGNAAKRMIMVWKEHSADDECQISSGKPTHGFWHFFNPLNWMEHWGIYWIGLWPFYKIYAYDFIWTEETTDDKGKIVPYTRRAMSKEKGGEGQTTFIKANDTNYFIVANDVKTKGGVPLKFVLLVTIRIENPRKALFSGEDWLERTGGAISNMTVRYAGVLTYEQITASEPATLLIISKNGVQGTITRTLEALIVMLGDGQPDDVQGTDQDLLTSYGIRIVAAKIHSFDFADDDAAKQFRDATTQKYVAEQKGLGEAAEAVGKATATRTLADAEEYRINKIYAPVAGDDKAARMQIRQLEATEKSGAAGGNTIIVPDEVLGFVRKFVQK